MAFHSLQPLQRPYARRHTPDDCEVCAAFCAEAMVLVTETSTCDRLNERELIARCGRSRGVFARHMGDVQRCLVTTYAAVADVVLTRFERSFADHDGWAEGFQRGAMGAIEDLVDRPGATSFFFVEADRCGDPVMWLERSAVRRRFLQILGDTPSASGDEIRLEMLAGAFHAIVRQRLEGGDRIDDPTLLSHDVAELIAVFAPSLA